MILPIYLYGSDVLKAQAAPLSPEEVNREELKTLIENMFETMRNADGVGLAAPQIGLSQQILIVDGSDLTDAYPNLKDFKRVMINPTILEAAEETAMYSEGCLSIPDIHCDIIRPSWMRVAYLDENLEPREEKFEGFACRMVQHEMDHLAGIVFTDKAAPIRKKMISSKLHNISRGKVRTHYRAKYDK